MRSKTRTYDEAKPYDNVLKITPSTASQDCTSDAEEHPLADVVGHLVEGVSAEVVDFGGKRARTVSLARRGLRERRPTHRMG